MKTVDSVPSACGHSSPACADCTERFRFRVARLNKEIEKRGFPELPSPTAGSYEPVWPRAGGTSGRPRGWRRVLLVVTFFGGGAVIAWYIAPAVAIPLVGLMAWCVTIEIGRIIDY